MPGTTTTTATATTGETGKGARFQPVVDALSAAITLGTGASLGPEGPSVDIGKSFARTFENVIPKRSLAALVAAGSAAGISAGFNAPISGVFFALESVLEKGPGEGGPAPSSPTTQASASSNSALNLAVVTLASVIAAIVSQIGLGSEPAMSIPDYSLGSYLDWPLYLMLGFLSGGVSLTFTKALAYVVCLSLLPPSRLFPSLHSAKEVNSLETKRKTDANDGKCVPDPRLSTTLACLVVVLISH